jgi:hypothetical protein
VKTPSESIVRELCDNETVLRVIKKWLGQGGKAPLATAPDTDILRGTVCLLTQRVQAGRTTFLIKVKSHRGEPINEPADTLAEEGQEISHNSVGTFKSREPAGVPHGALERCKVGDMVQGQTERQGHTNIPRVWEMHLRRQASKDNTKQ